MAKRKKRPAKAKAKTKKKRVAKRRGAARARKPKPPPPLPPRKPGEKFYWLMKSEPSVFSIADLRNKPDATGHWDGVRNYMARNHMMAMKPGDGVLFYHSSDDPVGVAGTAEVVREAYPDHTARDPKSEYYDPGATAEKPRWFMVDVKWTSTFPRLIPLEMLRRNSALRRMLILRRGNRLSVTPVSADEWAAILAMAG